MGLAAKKSSRFVVIEESWVIIDHTRPGGIRLKRRLKRLDGVH